MKEAYHFVSLSYVQTYCMRIRKQRREALGEAGIIAHKEFLKRVMAPFGAEFLSQLYPEQLQVVFELMVKEAKGEPYTIPGKPITPLQLLPLLNPMFPQGEGRVVLYYDTPTDWRLQVEFKGSHVAELRSGKGEFEVSVDERFQHYTDTITLGDTLQKAIETLTITP